MLYEADQVITAMNIWEWLMDTASDPSQDPTVVQAATDFLDELGRDKAQYWVLGVTHHLTKSYNNSLAADWEREASSYSDFVFAMMEGLARWQGSFGIPHEAVPLAVYTMMVAKEGHDLHYNEFMSMEFDYDETDLGFYITASTETDTYYLTFFKDTYPAMLTVTALRQRQERYRHAA